MGLVNSNKSKFFKTIILGCAGLSMVAALAIVFTSSNQNKNQNLQNSVAPSHTNNNDNENHNLLKLAPSGIKSSINNDFNSDLTILGNVNLKASLQQQQEQQEQEEEKEENEKNPVVRISGQGRIRGTVMKSRENRNYYAFHQVPYARPPVGKLRFALPEEPRRWFGIRDGTKIGKECLQREKYATEPNITSGSEDCLHLNIYTPKLPASRRKRDELKLPVMFYLHGGGPHGNGTRYGAKYLMDEDVVFVNVEFRLGMFGGFTAGTREFPGNLDSRDQVMAMQWVQKNIHRFGGDPKKVLLFGNSSGGAHVHAHLLSPMSKGLFHRAIMQSGTAINKALVKQEPLNIIRDFIVEVGCNAQNNTVEDTVNCLREIDGRTIALSAGQAAISGFYEETRTGSDVEDNNVPAFLPEVPWNLLDEGKVASHVPLIIGIVSNEMFHANNSLSQLLLEGNATELNDRFEELVPSVVGVKEDAEHSAGKKFRQVYFGDREVSNETRLELWDLFSDATAHGVRISGMAHANITQQPVYFYRISKEVGYSYGESIKKIYPPPYGLAHADELQYLFLYDGYPEYPVGSPWFEFSKKMVQIWVSFARDGKPNIQNLPGNKENVQWEPISLDDNGMEWLQLDDEIKYIQPFTKRMQLWDEYIEDLYVFN